LPLNKHKKELFGFLITVNPKIERRPFYSSTYFFEKKCLTKMLLTPIFHFFGLIRPQSAVLFQDLLNEYVVVEQ
jgi:hypothetical protein